jgi:hypothetical protein
MVLIEQIKNNKLLTDQRSISPSVLSFNIFLLLPTTTMRRISSSAQCFTSSPARAVPGSVRHYGVHPMSVRTMGLLPRGEGFLFQKDEGATSSVQQLNRIYILDKELRDLLRSEARKKPQEVEVAQGTHALSTEAAAPPSPSELVSTPSAEVKKTTTKSRSARSAQTKPIREPRASRKAVGSPSS